MKEILTENKKRLTIFEDKVVIDKRLPKWRNAEKGLGKTKVEEDNDGTVRGFAIGTPDSINKRIDVDSDVDISTKWLPLYEIAEGISFDELATAGTKELTRMIAENKLKFVIGGYGSLGNITTLFNNAIYSSSTSNDKNKETKSFFKNILNSFKNTFSNKNKEDKFEFDALKFFSLVKATSKDSVKTYRDRVNDYLKAIYNAVRSGQTALLEDLARGMVSSKYESVLYAEGLYYTVTEEQMIEFVKKCEKGIKLDYIKNFTRPLPEDVIDKIDKINSLEIFDNYVVLYYDPEGKIYKETAREEAKRKDPIIFGLIAGSNKLYYVADWVDEYCDLTLEKFIDVIGVKKEELHLDYKPGSNKEEEVINKEKVVKKKRNYKRKYNNKKKENKDKNV
jgi:hypothetical protein